MPGFLSGGSGFFTYTLQATGVSAAVTLVEKKMCFAPC